MNLSVTWVGLESWVLGLESARERSLPIKCGDHRNQRQCRTGTASAGSSNGPGRGPVTQTDQGTRHEEWAAAAMGQPWSLPVGFWAGLEG